jgi:ATP-dependent Clp protease ATP-binding subunit ClpB
MSFDFTEKTEATLAAAIQLAKDYANSQVQPVHFASVMLNEEAAPAPPGAMPKANTSAHGTSLLVQAIQKAGGDPVSSRNFRVD